MDNITRVIVTIRMCIEFAAFAGGVLIVLDLTNVVDLF
ncbi:hypothetical protein ACSSVZ_004949 [Amorphus sp. MBR-141]